MADPAALGKQFFTNGNLSQVLSPNHYMVSVGGSLPFRIAVPDSTNRFTLAELSTNVLALANFDPGGMADLGTKLTKTGDTLGHGVICAKDDLGPGVTNHIGMEVIESLAGNDDDDPVLAALLHDLGQSDILRETVRLVQHNGET